MRCPADPLRIAETVGQTMGRSGIAGPSQSECRAAHCGMRRAALVRGVLRTLLSGFTPGK